MKRKPSKISFDEVVEQRKREALRQKKVQEVNELVEEKVMKRLYVTKTVIRGGAWVYTSPNDVDVTFVKGEKREFASIFHLKSFVAEWKG